MDARASAALCALAALLLAACGSSSEVTAGPGGAGSTASPSASPSTGATRLASADAGTALGALAALEDGSAAAMRAKDPSTQLTPAVIAALGRAAVKAAGASEPAVTGVEVTDAALLPAPDGPALLCVVATRSGPPAGASASWAVVAEPGGRTAVVASPTCAAASAPVARLLPQMDPSAPPAQPLPDDGTVWAAGVVLTRPVDQDAVVLGATPAQLTAHGQEYVDRYRSQAASRLLDDGKADAAAVGGVLDDLRSSAGAYPTKVGTATDAGSSTQTVTLGGTSVALGPGSRLSALATTRARDAYCLLVSTSDGQKALLLSGTGLVGIPPLECSTARYPRSLLP